MAKYFTKSTKPISFCCSMMKDCLEDDRLYIDYDSRKKGFFTPLAWPHDNIIQFFSYCPWCGIKILPKELEEE